MKRFKNILFVQDRAVVCESSLARAVTLAQDNQAALTVIDVVEDVPRGVSAVPKGYTAESLLQVVIEELQEQLEDFVADGRKKMAIETQLLTGIPYLEVTRKVLRDGHDLVIKPISHSVGFKERLFGGTDLHLLRKCPVPVWLMKESKNTKINRVLAAVDIGHEEGKRASDDSLSLKILELASSLALSEFSELHIAHAWNAFGESMLRSGRAGISSEEVNDYVNKEENHHRLWIEELYQQSIQSLGEDALSYIKPKIRLPKGLPKDVIPTLTEDLDIDLIVMGTVARTGIPGFFMGNTAETILENIDCSVLAVKPEGFVSPVTLENAH